MLKILSNPSQIVTVDTNGINYKKGNSLKELNILYDHSVIIEDKIIKDFITNSEVVKLKGKADELIDVKDKVVLPGLVECHTHSAFTGSRANEFRERLNGKRAYTHSIAVFGLIITKFDVYPVRVVNPTMLYATHRFERLSPSIT